MNKEEIISVLLNRLGSSKPYNLLIIIQILKSIASENADYKDKMAIPIPKIFTLFIILSMASLALPGMSGFVAELIVFLGIITSQKIFLMPKIPITDVGSLSVLVKSLTIDVEEQKEVVGLILDLSDLPAVWRRIGRVQGCIVMLVSLLIGDDQVVSHDTGELLNVLSSNTQNALHMAEAGYFKPLVQYLKEGSDMSRILMATSLSKGVFNFQGGSAQRLETYIIK